MTNFFPLSPVPTISVHPKNVSVYLVGNITEISFSCKATGIPKPVIGWLKKNSTKSNGTVIQTGSISVLILPSKEKEKAPGSTAASPRIQLDRPTLKREHWRFLDEDHYRYQVRTVYVCE